MSKYLLALDQGTTGSTAVLVDTSLKLVGSQNVEFAQIYPQAGWVEHDPEAIWASVLAAISGVFEKTGATASEVIAIGITNQRETTVVWERETGRAIHNAIVWQCRRTADECRRLRDAGWQDIVQKKTGLVLDPYFSGTKIRWILEHVEGAREQARAGKLAFGTIDTWLLWRLTGGQVHATDVSNASRTLLMNLDTGAWDEELLKLFGVEPSLLPEIRLNHADFGTIKGVPGLLDGTPIRGIAGDQQSALFGQACFEPGMAKCTYGTGAFLLMNTGTKRVPSTRGMLTTAAWNTGDGITYALEGSAFIAGAAVQWVRDGLGLIKSAPEIEALANEVPDSGGVVFVPALTGLGAPHWNPDARGVLWGLTRGSTRAHIARAVLEGIAFQNRDILDAMERDVGRRLSELRVDGGACANNLLMQFQADVLDVPISRPEVVETTALGAALFAGLGAGVFSSLDAISESWREERRFHPAMSAEARAGHLARWQAGVTKA